MNINIAMGPWLPVPALQGGSTARIWQGLAEEFAAKGHQVTIFCRAYSGQPQQEVIKGVRYFRFGGFPQSRSILLDLIKDFIYALQTTPLLRRSDILVINDFWLPVFASIFRPDAGRIVLHVGRFPKGQYPLYAGVSRFVALSTAIEKAISHQYPPAISRVRVIPNPVDIAQFHPSSDLEKNRKTVLYVGRLHPEKGVHVLIDAFQTIAVQMPQSRLQIVGPYKENQGGGGEAYLQSLKARATGYNIEFLEPVFEVAQLAAIYRSANVFCYPSLAEKGESFPVAPLEAMASGLIPVVSDLNCFQDLIQEGITGYLFNHRDTHITQNLAKALFAALSNSIENETITSNAISKTKEYSYETIAAIYLKDFDELIAS